MLSAKGYLDAFCPPFLLKLKSRIVASPIGYRLARGAFWSLAGTLTSRALGLLAGFFVARLLGKHGYGQLGVVQSTLGMFGVFAGFGMGLTANKHVAEFRKSDPDRAGRIIGISSLVAWGTGGLMTLVLYLMAPWLARTTLAAPEMGGLLQVGAWLLVLGGVNGAQTGALAGFEAFKTIARVNLITGLAAFPITLFAAWFWGVTGSVWALVANLVFTCILNFIALRREAAAVGVPLGYRHCGREWLILWRFSVPAVLGGAVTGPITWAVNALLVNQADGYAQMGVYNAVVRIKIVPDMILGMLLAPLLPILSEKYAARDLPGYQKTARSAFTLALLVTTPFALLQIAVPAITLLPYGHAYAGHDAVVQWLMAEAAVLGFLAPMSQMVMSMNKMWFGFGFNLVWALIYGLLALFLVPRFGAAGLAASPLLAHLICLGPTLYYIRCQERELVVGVPLGLTALGLCSIVGFIFASEQYLSSGVALSVAVASCGGLFLLRGTLARFGKAPQN
jgi:O-antigen/teichoic acid export membrane protein